MAISRVLLIGVDSPIGLTVLRELGAHGLEVICVGRGRQSLGRNSRYCHTFVERPPGAISGWLAALVAEHSVTAVMAVSEGDLLQLARLKGTLKNCTLAVPDSDKLALVLDKQATLAAARTTGIDVPSSWQPENSDELAAKAAEIDYPVAIKWADPPAVADRLSQAGLELEKVEYADDAGALLAILHRYDAFGAYPLVQSYCPGYGLGQMLNMKGGKATLHFQHRRLREWPISGGVSTCCKAEPLSQHREQMVKSEKLLRQIGWEGPAMVEYRHDPASGKYWLMEINGRFWGSIPLAHHARAEFGWEAYRTQVLGETDPMLVRVDPITARYMVPDFKHLLAVLRDSSRGLGRRIGFALRFLGQLLNPATRYYVWSWRDPGPFFADARSIIAKALRRGK
ncbi:MAG: carboxylate--amine ligase [Altererythrobacter sp.]|nr:carboxylate--amine ligase [Altererythrobacter sp.]